MNLYFDIVKFNVSGKEGHDVYIFTIDNKQHILLCCFQYESLLESTIQNVYEKVEMYVPIRLHVESGIINILMQNNNEELRLAMDSSMVIYAIALERTQLIRTKFNNYQYISSNISEQVEDQEDAIEQLIEQVRNLTNIIDRWNT